MPYECSICHEKMEKDLIVLLKHTESHIIDEIKAQHPDWVEDSGICTKCLGFYKDQMKEKNSW